MKKILIIEDNLENRVMMRDILQHHNYEVWEAANGSEGLTKAALIPDLILLDIQMPGMDGYAVIKKLRGAAETRKIRVVAVTSFVMKGDREKILESGFDHYIAKPIDIREFPRLIRDFIGR